MRDRTSNRWFLVVAAACLTAAWSGAAEVNLLANGGFESCGRLGAWRSEAQTKAGMTFDSKNPLLPYRWFWSPHGTFEFKLSADAHSGQYALQSSGAQGGVDMEMQNIEVVPGATYAFGGWAKGKGSGYVSIYGLAYEGRREIARVEQKLTNQWTESRKTVTIPGNMRTVAIGLGFSGAPALVDDIFFSANVAAPFDVNAVLTTKYRKDEHTLAFVDFDEPGNYRLESKAKLTDDKGGRFGKGVRLEEQDVASVVIPLTLKTMPPEGTLEFWFSPDDDTLPGKGWNFATLLSGAQRIAWFDNNEMMRLKWRLSDKDETTGFVRWGWYLSHRAWIRTGNWHHIAVTWDPEAVRLYVDGVLASYSTTRPLPFLALPSAISFGGNHVLNSWSGGVDEFRLSDIKRYSPLVPAGAKWRPLVSPEQRLGAAQAGKPAQTAAPPKAAPPPDFAKERKLLIGAIPKPPADAIAFAASRMKPLLQDDRDFQILTNTPIPGMTVARSGAPSAELGRMPDNDGAYWKLSGVPAGKYYVGIWYESSRNELEAPQQIRGYLWAYLNGRCIQLSTHSEPVQVTPGLYYVEAQSKDAEPLKDGDEIAVLVPIWQPVRLARLVLHRSEPARGHGWIFENYGASGFARDSALRMNALCGFRVESGKRIWRTGMEMEIDSPDCFKKAADGRALAYYQVANTLPVPLTVKCKVEVRAYFREIVGTEETTVTLNPHERVTRELPFTILPDSARYTMEIKVNAVSPPKLDWPPTDTIDFFEGVRQSVSWPDPFNSEFHRSICFAQPVAGIRREISLNGQWEGAFTAIPTALPVPVPSYLKWEPRQVPLRADGWAQKPQAHGLYLKRTFRLPEGDGKRTWRLLIKEVMDEATLYVNGQKIGNVRGVGTPLFCDITKALRPGENEILIALRDGLANMDPVYVNPNNPVANPSYLEAPGSICCASFMLSNVKLKSSPMVTAEDLQVGTSVRKMEIAANFKVVNRETAGRKLKVKAQVLDAGKPVMDVGEETVDLAAGAAQGLKLSKSWKDPVFWGPGSPKLYTMAITVSDAETGKNMDLFLERFGFRESWVEKGRIMLNGAPVRLKGSNCGGGGGTMNWDDVQWTRGSDGMEDFLDENGVLTGLYTLGGLGNTPSRHNIENNSFWEIERKNVLAGAALYVNHPCLIAWDLSNEWLSFAGYYSGTDPLFGARRFKTVGDALLAYDPTRWIIFDGDGDLFGLWEIDTQHYMMPYKINPGQKHSAYLPDSRFWRELDADLDPATAGSGWDPKHIYDATRKVIMNTENAWKVDGLQPPGLSIVLGEDDILGPAIDSGRGGAVWYWKQNVDGHRDLGASIVCNYTMVTGLNRRGHLLQCFILPLHVHRFFSAGKFESRYSLHNDLVVPSKFDFRWSLVDGKGRIVLRGHDARGMNSGDLQRGKIAFEMPKVRERTPYTLKLDLFADGKFVEGEERDIQVYPDALAQFAAPQRKIFLFDPAGKTAGIFRKAGIPFTPIDKLGAPAGKPSDAVLVLGEGAVKGDADAAGAMIAFTDAGGRIIALMQDKLPPGLPVKTTLDPREWCSMLFMRTPQHPLLQGLVPGDLRFWASDHVVAKGSYTRPEFGSCITILDGASDHDRNSKSVTEWAQLMECFRGQGSYLVCQLPLADKYDIEPMARKMLSRIVAYAAGATAYRSPVNSLKVVADQASAAIARLRDMGVSFKAVGADLAMNQDSVSLVDLAFLPANFTAPPSWKDALAKGATILAHGATPAHTPLLSALAGRPVEITVQPYAMWEGRGYRNGYPWLTPGLSHVDLYWKDYAGDEGACDQAERPRYKIEDLNYWSVKAEGAIEHVFPGALVEIPVGKGRLVIDNLRWDSQNAKLDKHTRRAVSSLMAGLNIAVAPYFPARTLPQDVISKPIDLSAFCNRGFQDDLADDGKGGWTDQGPAADLREFPAGNQNFGGVPFKIGKEPRGCIVLKSDARPNPALLPDEASIPVGYPAEGFWFLHASAFGVSGAYQVQYEDGTLQEIALADEENLRDWIATPAEFRRERGTSSRVAWTGSNERYPLVCVYQMLWVNPKPDTPVKAVRFVNPAKRACPILIALTAVVKPGKADFEAIAAAQAKAQAWLQKGSAAMDAGQDAAARAALLQAVQADPKLDAAHQRLCELAERGRDEDVVLATCQAWAATHPRTPLPYNKIGAMLQRKGDNQGALEAYTKSLEVEWNQPPIIEAKSRLTLKLK